MPVDSTFVITVVGTGMGIIIGMGAIVITLFIYSQGKMDAALTAIHDEMKDFHGKLERQDAEFKAFMRLQEERRTQALTGNR